MPDDLCHKFGLTRIRCTSFSDTEFGVGMCMFCNLVSECVCSVISCRTYMTNGCW